jgi:hypothetical protein
MMQETQRGNGYAQWAIGGMYMTGQGVPKNRAMAVHWLGMAYQHGGAIGQQAASDLQKIATANGMPTQQFRGLLALGALARMAPDSKFGHLHMGFCDPSGICTFHQTQGVSVPVGMPRMQYFRGFIGFYVLFFVIVFVVGGVYIQIHNMAPTDENLHTAEIILFAVPGVLSALIWYSRYNKSVAWS